LQPIFNEAVCYIRHVHMNVVEVAMFRSLAFRVEANCTSFGIPCGVEEKHKALFFKVGVGCGFGEVNWVRFEGYASFAFFFSVTDLFAEEAFACERCALDPRDSGNPLVTTPSAVTFR
jgi:hypothetical protein